MKSTIFILATIIFLGYSCQDSTKSTDSSKMTDMKDLINVKDTISEKKFNKWKKEWDKNGEAYMDTAALFQYFTLPIIDLTQVVAETAKSAKY